MPTRLNPYISFKDNAREALQYYHEVFGGTLDTTTFKDGGVPHDAADADKLMHGMLTADTGIVLMAADTPASMARSAGSNISISLSGDDEAELRGYFDKLSDSGAVTMPLEKAPWGDVFGMCTDKFGVNWMVNVSGEGGADAG